MSAPKTVRLRIHADKCQGHNRCKAIAPDLIDLDGFGNASHFCTKSNVLFCKGGIFH